jgi:tagaturonate reductase
LPLYSRLTAGTDEVINEQEGLYTLYLRGAENGEKVDSKRVISSVDACYNPYDPEDWKKIGDRCLR